MNLFSKTLKIGLAAILMAMVPSVSAQAKLTRTPERARVSIHDGSATPEQQAEFLSLVNRKGHNPYKLSAAPKENGEVKAIPQRPQSIMRSATDPKGRFLAVVPSHTGASGYNNAYLGSLDPVSGRLTPLFYGTQFSNGEDYFLETGAVRDGLLYIPAYTQDMVTKEISVYWKVIDIETGKQVDTINFGKSASALEAFLYAMTYDPEEDVFYGLGLSLTSYTYGHLVKIDCKEASWTATSISDVGGTSGDCMSTLVFNPEDRMLYGLKDDFTMYQIDIFTDPRVVNILNVREYDDFYESYMQAEDMASNAMCYSPYDHAYFFIYRNSFLQKMTLVGIDADSFDAFEVADVLPLGFTATLICTDAYADDSAPDRMAAPTITFDKASTDGKITFTAPATTFNGVAITTPMTITLLIDGAQKATYSAKAGETQTHDLSVATGQHEAQIYASLGDLNGPKGSLKFYAGYDNPLPPTNVTIDGTRISWTAPAEGGEHGGYVDLSNVTYDVYFDGEKQNVNPLTATAFKFANPDALVRKAITVTATANGMTSRHSDVLSRVIGEAHSIPFAAGPDNAGEATLFETYDANKDANKFTFYTEMDGSKWMSIRTEQYKMPDDWVFLPLLSFENADDLYELSMQYGNSYGSERMLDNLDIMIGTDCNPESMSRLIYTHSERKTPKPERLSVNFAVEAPGEYVIGIHSKPGSTNNYRGVRFRDFSVKKTEGSSKAPAKVEDITLKADARGDLYLDADVTVPTNDIIGRGLDADKEITIVISTNLETMRGKGKPGQKLSFTSLPAEADGFTTVNVYAEGEGKGPENRLSAYVGLDVPTAPTNVKSVIDKDNLGMHITWEAPTKGVNGGYFDPEDLTYEIHSKGSAGQTAKLATTKELSYNYRIAASARQAAYHVGPVAVNRMGNSTGSIFVYETLGTPYELPMTEDWNNVQFTYSKWYFSTNGEYAASEIENVKSMTGSELGDPVFEKGGGMRVFNLAGTPSTRYELCAPKPSTLNTDHAAIRVRYWDYPEAGTIELWGRTCDDQEFKLLKEIVPARETAQWIDYVYDLPADYNRKNWIQINIRGTLEGNAEVLLDTYSILQNLERDFSVLEVSTPPNTTVGETVTFQATLANSGNEPYPTTALLEVLGDGKQIAFKSETTGQIKPGNSHVFALDVDMTDVLRQYKKLEARVTITDPEDMNAENNMKSVEFTLNANDMPMVSDLKATREGSDVVLSWSKPSTEYGSNESFETSKAFDINEAIGYWTNVDLDKQKPFAINADQYRFEGDQDPHAWVVWDAKKMGSTKEARLCAHSGSKALIAFSNDYKADEGPTKSFDWLISPEVVGGTELTFWYNTLDPQYKETVELWVSSTDMTLDPDNMIYAKNSDGSDNLYLPRKCGSWRWVENFTKSGEETWEFNKTKLPDDAKYFALVYGSVGMFGAMIDDIAFTPKETLNWEIDSYDLFRIINHGNPEVVKRGIKECTYREENDAKRSRYFLQTVVYANGEKYNSPNSNVVEIAGTGVEGIYADAYVLGEKGCVTVCNAAGADVELYDVDGRHLTTVKASSDRMSIAAEAGVAVVKLGERYYKVMVK